jgi:hypothetical protein
MIDEAALFCRVPGGVLKRTKKVIRAQFQAALNYLLLIFLLYL